MPNGDLALAGHSRQRNFSFMTYAKGACSWMLHPGVLVPRRPFGDLEEPKVVFTLHGAAKLPCVRALEETWKRRGVASCGIADRLAAKAGNYTVYPGAVTRVRPASDGRDGGYTHGDKKSTEHPDLAFFITCQLRETLSPWAELELRTRGLVAYLRTNLSHHSTPTMLHTTVRPATLPPLCNLRVCSKVYGNGGILAQPGYARFLAARALAMGVRDWALYALEALPSALEQTLAEPYVSQVIRLVRWDDRPFSWRDKGLNTRDKQASEWVEDENSRREVGALNHCMKDAVGAFDWVSILDVDEHIVVHNNASNGTVSLCDALLHSAPRASFMLPSISHKRSSSWRDDASSGNKPCRKEFEQATLAAKKSHEMREKAGLTDPQYGWKSVFMPDLLNAGSDVDAHGMGLHDPLVPPSIAYIRHVRDWGEC